MILPDSHTWPASIRASAAACALAETLECAGAIFHGRKERDWIHDVPLAERGRYEDLATRLLVLLDDGSEDALNRLERALAKPQLERIK